MQTLTINKTSDNNGKYNKKMKRKIRSFRYLQYKEMACDMRTKKIMYCLSNKTSILETRKNVGF